VKNEVKVFHDNIPWGPRRKEVKEYALLNPTPRTIEKPEALEPELEA